MSRYKTQKIYPDVSNRENPKAVSRKDLLIKPSRNNLPFVVTAVAARTRCLFAQLKGCASNYRSCVSLQQSQENLRGRNNIWLRYLWFYQQRLSLLMPLFYNLACKEYSLEQQHEPSPQAFEQLLQSPVSCQLDKQSAYRISSSEDPS